jgi:long-chain fatty acid transport protein
VRLNEHWSIGIGASYQQLDAELTNAVNYSAVVAQGVAQLVAAGQIPPAAAPGIIAANAGLEGHARVQGDDDAWGYNVGILWDVSPATRIGLTYRSSLSYEVSGTIDFGAPTAANPVGAAIVAAASAPGAALSDGDVSVELKLPDTAVLSLQQGLGERWALLADVGWTGWSSVQELRIVRDSGQTVSVTPERWEDVWRYALGVTYGASETLVLRAGVAYDNTPVPDETRTPRLPDTNRTWTTIGVHWELTPQWVLDAAYAHLFSEDVPLDQDGGNALASGVLRGEQVSDIDIVSAQVVFRFR